MTIGEMVTAARIELADPRAQKPSYRHLKHLAIGVVQAFFNKLANSGRTWTVGETVLSVSSGTDEYSLGISGAGKVLDVVTYESDNQEGTERQIPFHDLTDLVGDYRGWDWPGASRIAFFRKNGQDLLYAKFRPIPTENRDYYITFGTGAWASEASLDDNPLLSQHHYLLVSQLAYNALPATEWSNDPKADSFKRQSLGRTLEARIREYEKDLMLYIASVNVPRVTERWEAFPIEG